MQAALAWLRASHRVDRPRRRADRRRHRARPPTLTAVMDAQEQETLGLRFQLRGVQPADDVALLAIDDESLADLGALAVPALAPRPGGRRAARRRRARHRLRRPVQRADAGARRPRAVRRARPRGRRRAGRHGDRRAAATPRCSAGARTSRRSTRSPPRRPSSRSSATSTCASRTPPAGCAPWPSRPRGAPGAGSARDDFEAGGAWIDYRGPPGTMPTVSFSTLLDSPRAWRRRCAGRIVVVGVTAPTEQDVHATPTSSDRLMSGPEIQANAIWTALHGLPLRSAPEWLAWLAVAVLGLGPAVAALRGRADARRRRRARCSAPATSSWRRSRSTAGHVLPVVSPLVALLLGTMSAMSAAYVAEREQPPARRLLQRAARARGARPHGGGPGDAARGGDAGSAARSSGATPTPAATSTA